MTKSTPTPVTTPPTTSGAVVRHDENDSRYILTLTGETVGLADYWVSGQNMHFTHTEVDPSRRNQGLAGILIEQALNDARTRTDLTVVPDCPYVAHWIDQHAEYQDLLTRGR
ncbi:N-acetyltransferase [Cryobacterium melibiosiphilum]|uniref:N-acetyltransferase n=1 Tax=Cryobacterium melibiosiphilum TaxID=995039 RepID=A0A3A5MRD8_9MICO|nr:GNAT family N-acetyltransferase [Cryobacterium melibiosiphilum]RJT87964.1 N-acetyltransferase [Cryobacterium melibiosiphilum]